MYKKVLALVLCIMVSVTILFAGCTKEQVSDDTETKVNSTIEDTDDTQNINTKEDIQDALKKDEKIADIIWSKDNSMVAFTKYIDDFEKQLYIWNILEESEKQIEGVSGNLYEIRFSPNDKYITVNEGTSNVYETIIITIEDFKIVDRVVNAGGPVWSPDSQKIAFAVLNDKEPIIPMELSGTTDLMIYDIKANIKPVVLEANNYFILSPVYWDKNGLKYEKSYLDDRQSEELIYEDTDYYVITEVYTGKAENIEVEIKYPVVINMGNKEVEEKINNIIIEKAGINLESDGSDNEDFKETLYTGYEITKKSNDILSIYFFSSLFIEGAAHPSRYIDSVTFDLETGEILELNDLFKEESDYKNILNSILKEKVKELDLQVFNEFKGLEEEHGFYLKDNNLVIYYQEGVYTPYAYGPLFLEISLDDINDISK